MIRLPFSDRTEAGQLLAEELLRRKLPKDTLVLALPRGGVPVGLAVAKALGAPLDVVIVRKLGVPGQPELAMGSIADGAAPVLDAQLIQELGVAPEDIEALAAKEREEIRRREKRYCGGRPAPTIRGRAVIIVDDGLATGSTMASAARYVATLKPGKLIAAVPVGSVQACNWIGNQVEECICLATPEPFTAVGEWYSDFSQVSDAEVQRLLALANPKLAKHL